jgi:hypothetical protein
MLTFSQRQTLSERKYPTSTRQDVELAKSTNQQHWRRREAVIAPAKAAATPLQRDSRPRLLCSSLKRAGTGDAGAFSLATVARLIDMALKSMYRCSAVA